MRRYTDAVIREIECRREAWALFTFDTLFIGGGTPSLLPPEMLDDILSAVRRSLKTHLIESTIEANPGTVGRELLYCYKELGINRISFGMQAAQDRLLKKIGRIHTADDCRKSAALAMEAGISNISFDLMSGLPGQDETMLLQSIDFATSLGASHLSLYTLKLESGTKLEADVISGTVELPGEDQEWAMSAQARIRLAELGFDRYEISNYAKPGFECRHNIKYWHRAPYIGLGTAAASFDGIVRTQNTPDLRDYMDRIESGLLPFNDTETLSGSDAAFEELMLALRMTRGLDCDSFRNKFGIDIFGLFADIIARYKTSGCLNIKNGSIALTDKGMDIQNRILVEFMEAWPNQIIN